MAIAWLWLHATSITLLTGLGMAALCWALGARPTVVRFHVGPTLFAFKLFGARWSLGPLTMGTSLSFNADDEPEGSVPPAWQRLAFPQRLVLISSSVLILLLFACICLGPARALGSMLSGFEQVVNVLRAPERVEAFLSLRPLGVRTTLGVFAAKLAAFNLLPLPPLAGFVLLREVVRTLRKQPPAETTSLPIWGFVLLLVLWGGWAWGGIKGVWNHGAKYEATEATRRQ